jgi:hypothetical protein
MVLGLAIGLLSAGACVERADRQGEMSPPTLDGGIEYRLDAPVPDSGRTKILVLATEHLRALGDGFDAGILDSLLGRLEAWGPDLIGVEALPPGEIRRLIRVAESDPDGAAGQIVGAFAADAIEHAPSAGRALGFDAAGAFAGVDTASTPPSLSAAARRRRALVALAAYDVPTALLQWSYLSSEDRAAPPDVPVAVAAFLEARLRAADETSAIGVRLSRLLSHDRIASIDDHVDDEIGIDSGLNDRLMAELQGNPALDSLVKSSYFQAAATQLPEAAATGDLLTLYRRLNSREHLDEDVRAQWHLFYRSRLPSGLDVRRAALWEARNLHIAGRIRAASAAVVGGKMLVIIGAAHKPFLDTYLDRMMDVEIVSADAVLGERTTRAAGPPRS